jgi:hypothetical protein
VSSTQTEGTEDVIIDNKRQSTEPCLISVNKALATTALTCHGVLTRIIFEKTLNYLFLFWKISDITYYNTPNIERNEIVRQ